MGRGKNMPIEFRENVALEITQEKLSDRICYEILPLTATKPSNSKECFSFYNCWGGRGKLEMTEKSFIW